MGSRSQAAGQCRVALGRPDSPGPARCGRRARAAHEGTAARPGLSDTRATRVRMDERTRHLPGGAAHTRPRRKPVHCRCCRT